ncbi:MAG: site-2 protease family protein [Chthoniobacterales bacterium]
MQSGSIRLFKIAGITVFLHFTWLLVGAYQVQTMSSRYSKPIWAVYEYLALFAIVLMHEFGHALACRQTGGHAEQIVLWPLGGIAFVSPPPRPGAMLWSIAAGPLVNIVLVPILALLLMMARNLGWAFQAPDLFRLIRYIALINTVILIFNLLPIYPLDGGQILRAVLWFPFGRIRSLQVACVIGLIGGAGLALYAVLQWSIWLIVMSFFLLSRALAGWRQASWLAAEERESRRIAEMPRERPVI